jgi:hypothetical protein
MEKASRECSRKLLIGASKIQDQKIDKGEKEAMLF